MKEQPAQVRWEQRTQRPLLAFALVFAVAYAVPIVRPDASRAVNEACSIAEWVVWGAFALDYVVRLVLSPDRRHFVRSHPLDLLAVVLPLAQPLRLLRVVSTLMLVGRRARMAEQIRLTTYVGGAVVGLLMFGSLAVLSVERESPEGNIKTLGDAVWWSFTTMTTVGYGDHAPTTGMGRVIAVGLMLSGIALLGVVTANIAAWFISRFEKDDAQERRQMEAIEALAHEVRALRAQVAVLSGQPAPPNVPVTLVPGAAVVPGSGSPDQDSPGPRPSITGSPKATATGSSETAACPAAATAATAAKTDVPQSSAGVPSDGPGKSPGAMWS
ncbi:potassium channel family protein [Streptomyces sp. SID14478]|uniref:potassium channel family protein n=1 Tax=Streptomyces sp. SID14478 TaxID=2706073 RepID=UPI001EF1E22D|nr:potassium channel family protein [Streptomyces sp. SID14478]